jgi:hypothetical protein
MIASPGRRNGASAAATFAVSSLPLQMTLNPLIRKRDLPQKSTKGTKYSSQSALVFVPYVLFCG